MSKPLDGRFKSRAARSAAWFGFTLAWGTTPFLFFCVFLLAHSRYQKSDSAIEFPVRFYTFPQIFMKKDQKARKLWKIKVWKNVPRLPSPVSRPASRCGTVAQKWRCGLIKSGLSKNRPNSMKSTENRVPGVFLHGNHESAISFSISRTSEP